MKTLYPLIALICLLFSSLLVGALLSYPFYMLINLWIDYPIDKAIKHTSIFSGFVITLYLLKKNHLLNREALGYEVDRKSFLTKTVAGFLIGCLIVALLEFLLLWLGVHGPDRLYQEHIEQLGSIILAAFIVGIVVALIEETLFRGLIISYLKPMCHTWLSILYSALLYSSLHYLNFPSTDDSNHVGWLTGIANMPNLFLPMIDGNNLHSFSTIFALGLLLGILRIRHSHIAACIGLHAGLVFLIKVSRKLTDLQTDSGYDYLISPVDHQMGLLASLIILLFFILLLLKPAKIH